MFNWELPECLMVNDAVRLWRFVFYPTLCIDHADYGQLDCCKKNLKFDWCKHKQPMVGMLHLFFPVNIRCQRWSDTWGPDILLNVRRRWCENGKSSAALRTLVEVPVFSSQHCSDVGGPLGLALQTKFAKGIGSFYPSKMLGSFCRHSANPSPPAEWESLDHSLLKNFHSSKGSRHVASVQIPFENDISVWSNWFWTWGSCCKGLMAVLLGMKECDLGWLWHSWCKMVLLTSNVGR